MDDLSGQEIRGYKIIERIGEGGFGIVYRAEQPAVDREVSIKVILPEFAEHPEFVQRFEAEARMVAKLEHPHIVPLYDYWRDEEGTFLVMRWLRGGSLREAIEGGPLEIEVTGQLLEQIAGALNVAHKQGVIHRDLKPENILLDEEGNAYLTDFGIAKDIAGEGLTQTGKIVGSVDYLAPEQAKGEEVTPRTDIYGLGVVLYEMLTGEHPFPGLTPIQTLQKHLNQPLPPIRASRSEIPEALDLVVQRATAKDPAERYSDALEVVEAYKRALTIEEAPTYEPQLPAFLEELDQEIEVQRPVFVGRERELARLDEYLQKTLTGQGQVVFVIGGAGRGKTALLEEFSRRAQEKNSDLIVATGFCNAHTGVGDPYLPFRHVLEMLTGDVERRWQAGGITSEHARRLWTQLPDAAGELVDSAPDLINRLIPGTSLTARVKTAGGATQKWWTRLNQLTKQEKPGTGDLEQAFLFEQCSRFLRSLSHMSPLLLAFDDLQWADAASIGLLFHLGRTIASSRILLVGAYRPDDVALGRVSPTSRQSERHPLESVVNELTRTHGDVTLDLTQEDESEGRAFVEAFLDSEPHELAESFREALFTHTGGHALFTVELLRTMQERGDLIKNDQGNWIPGTELNWEDLPARVEAVIAERIGRLDRELREMISVASVEGEEFTAQVVARVRKTPELETLHDLAEVAGKPHRLVKEHDEIRAGSQLLARFKFAHQLFQRYLYNNLGTGERRLLHRQIAEVLEQLYREQVEEIAVALAYHHREAGVGEKALPYLIMAGDNARDQYANEEAESYYRGALDLTTEDPQRAKLLRELGRIFVRKSQFAEGIEAWKEAIDLYQSSNDWDAVAWLYARSARAASTAGAGDDSMALEICLEGISKVPVNLDSAEMAALLHETGRAYFFNGMLEEALPLCEAALEIAERFQAVEVQADTLVTLGLLPNQSLNDSVKTIASAVELAESAGFDRIASRGHHNLAFLLGWNDLSEARRHMMQSAEISQRRGDLEAELFTLGNFATQSMMQGDLQAADEAISRMVYLQEMQGKPNILVDYSQAELLIMRGHLAQAIEIYQDLRDNYQKHGNPLAVLNVHRDMSKAFKELGEINKARDLLEEAMPFAGEISGAVRVSSRAELSMIYSLQLSVDKSRQILSEAREFAGPEPSAYEQAFLYWATAHLCAAAGEWQDSFHNYEMAVATWEHMDHRWYAVWVIRDWAEAYANHGLEGDIDQARGLLERAREIYEEMGTPYFVDLIEKKLEGLQAEAEG